MDDLIAKNASKAEWNKWKGKWDKKWTTYSRKVNQVYKNRYRRSPSGRSRSESRGGRQNLLVGLMSLSDAFSSSEQSQQFWGDATTPPDQVTIKFDNSNNKVTVQSDAVDANGKPIHEWQLNQNTGRIE